MKWRIAVAFCILLTISGCGMLPGVDEAGDQQSPTTDYTVTSTAGMTAHATSGTTTESTTKSAEPPSTTVTITGSYNLDFPTDSVQLSLSEVGDTYELAGETQVTRSNASGERLTALQDRGALLVHERAYESTTNDAPALIFVSIVVYESPEDADEWLSTHLSEIEASGGSVSSVDVTSGVEAKQAAFDSSNDLRTVALYDRQSNLVFYVAVADDTPAQVTVEVLFIKILGDIP